MRERPDLAHPRRNLLAEFDAVADVIETPKKYDASAASTTAGTMTVHSGTSASPDPPQERKPDLAQTSELIELLRNNAHLKLRIKAGGAGANICFAKHKAHACLTLHLWKLAD